MAIRMILLASLLVLVAHDAHANAADAFARLAKLAGAWEGTLPDGRMHRVTYRMTAADTVLVETWTLGAGRESITMYHRDGDALVATHYCPQATQPRLQLVDAAGSDRLDFAFRDGTNLQDPAKYHQHSFWLRFVDADTFERSETYVANGPSDAEPTADEAPQSTTFHRAK